MPFSNAVRLLARRPDVFARLRRERTLVPRFIEQGVVWNRGLITARPLKMPLRCLPA